jgi:lipid-A-disaccharide synthase
MSPTMLQRKKKLLGVGGGGLGEDCKWALGPWPAPPNPAPPKILIVAGEASGDAYAACLVAAIRKREPRAEFLGVGGEALTAQGVRILCPASELAVVGLSEVARHLPVVLRALRDIARVLQRERPSLVILVDFPDFNFWVARLARFRRVPVMYYISPQVWAWRTYRVHTIARLVDRMVVIFPFEAEFYRPRGVPVEYVGHPLMETLPPAPERRTWLAKQGLDPARLTIALLPGSRASEIRRHLPLMLAGAKLINQAIPQCQFVLPLASTVPEELVRLEVVGAGLKPAPTIIPGQSFEALAAAQVAVVASGTATVEAALAGTPTVIVYRLSPLSYRAGRWLIRVPHIGMANLLAGEGLFPELIQEDFTSAGLAREVLALIGDSGRLKKMRRGLGRVVAALGGPGASARAADVALELMAAGRRH